MNQVRTRDRGWVRALNSVANPAVRLVCFPYSGGSAATYRAWASAMPAGFQLIAVQYPGHADRIAAAPAGSVAEMASSVAGELARLDPARCALFGHSLGAVVAYETAKVLQNNGTPADCLFVSGAAAPWQAGGGTTHRATDDELWSALRDLGGIEADIADHAELRELLLPVLRSDIALHETYRPAPETEPLRCQVRCYYNTEDPLVDSARLVAWAAVGTGRFGLRAWPGGHFQSLTDSTELIGDIVATLAESGVPQ
ncbi:thioesterase II family protein [Nocardia sp. NPDC051321]|uniref:thioesterase II family protein n=1 Tax=Nocardia sp. NPDC051321 TaxID=3364323 RepID=UPI0037AFDC07